MKIVFNLLNLFVGILILVIGCFRFIDFKEFNATVIGFYLVCAGIGLIVHEIVGPGFISQWFPFLNNWFGRGSTYFIMSCMVVGYNPAGNIIGIVTYIISIVWIVFFFVKAFEFPGPIAGSGGPTAAV
eukprot:TRINITY_DN4362_c0_g1_i1.p1 TRINITY_DN4362_c0_g1~~TRINITY_DN4362_c0_g1_i1.p1  ORF type:complete len:128 (+),score=29.71 TRINITY_DN4362_c0_g1_i1:49-432(+)